MCGAAAPAACSICQPDRGADHSCFSHIHPTAGAGAGLPRPGRRQRAAAVEWRPHLCRPPGARGDYAGHARTPAQRPPLPVAHFGACAVAGRRRWMGPGDGTGSGVGTSRWCGLLHALTSHALLLSRAASSDVSADQRERCAESRDTLIDLSAAWANVPLQPSQRSPRPLGPVAQQPPNPPHRNPFLIMPSCSKRLLV